MSTYENLGLTVLEKEVDVRQAVAEGVTQSISDAARFGMIALVIGMAYLALPRKWFASARKTLKKAVS